MARLTAAEQAADVAALLRASEESTPGLVPFNRIARQFVLITGATEHLQIACGVKSAPRNRLDVIEFEFRGSPAASGAAASGSFSDFLEFGGADSQARAANLRPPVVTRGDLVSGFVGETSKPLLRLVGVFRRPALIVFPHLAGMRIHPSAVVRLSLFGVCLVPFPAVFAGRFRVPRSAQPFNLARLFRVSLLPCGAASYLFCTPLGIGRFSDIVGRMSKALALTTLSLRHVALCGVSMPAWFAREEFGQPEATRVFA